MRQNQRFQANRRPPRPHRWVQLEPRTAPSALGSLIETWTPDRLSRLLHDGLPEIANCQFVASYNLTDSSKTIFVPGKPPLWTPSSVPLTLHDDSGIFYRDENAARFGWAHFDPMIASVLHMDPSFDPSHVDVVACGSTLGNLLRFVRGSAEPFSMTAHRLGTTVFLSRREHSPTERIEDIHGFGHRFVESNTTWDRDVLGSSSHQRIVSYDLGLHRMLVRFEVDAYIIEQSDDLGLSESSSLHQDGGVPIEELLESMNRPRRNLQTTSDMQIIDKGARVGQSSIIDIKTRSARKDRAEVILEQLPRLWLRQIENLVLAFHNRGNFGPADTEDIRESILEWEGQSEANIAQLVNLIDLIKTAVAKQEPEKMEVRYEGGGSVTFHSLAPQGESDWDPLSERWRRQWILKGRTHSD